MSRRIILKPAFTPMAKLNFNAVTTLNHYVFANDALSMQYQEVIIICPYHLHCGTASIHCPGNWRSIWQMGVLGRGK